MNERSVPFMLGLAVTRNSVVSIYSAASKCRGMKWPFGHLQNQNLGEEIVAERLCRVSLRVQHIGF